MELWEGQCLHKAALDATVAGSHAIAPSTLFDLWEGRCLHKAAPSSGESQVHMELPSTFLAG